MGSVGNGELSRLKRSVCNDSRFQFKKLKSFIDEHPDLKEIDAWVRLYEKVKDFNDKKGRWSDDGSINIENILGQILV